MNRYIVKTENGYVYDTLTGYRADGRRENAESFCKTHAEDTMATMRGFALHRSPEVEAIDRVNAPCRLCEAASL